MARRFETDGDYLVHVRLRPLWAYIDGMREFCAFFCETTFEREKLADRVRLVIHELLENAVKYSASEWNEIEVSIRTTGSTYEIRVSNYPDEASGKWLLEELARLREMDPEAAYQAALVRAATAPAGQSRLGLARIRFEGNVDLSAEQNEDGQICVTAKGEL